MSRRMLTFLVLISKVLADDCTLVKEAWVAMGKTASAGSCCFMPGVDCANDGSVRKIDWSLQNLVGQISPSLGNLSQLTVLNLGNNQLSGSIPRQLGALSQLSFLDLRNNQLSNAIPSSFQSLSQLTVLHLEKNRLSGPIPSFIGQLSKLTYLNGYENQFSGYIPTSLGNLGLLTYLSFGNNYLMGPIPGSLGNLKFLTLLDLRNNQLSDAIPSSLGSLNQLNYLYLYNNKLRGPIPSQLGSLSQLIYLNLYNNELSGNIPSSFGGLTQLTTMYLHRNQLTGVPSSLKSLTNCKIMGLLPNPMTLIPYDVAVKNPISTMSASEITSFLAIKRLAKRASTSNVATLSTADLLKMCPLNYVENQDVLIGCIAGIVYFCQDQTDLSRCRKYYGDVFAYSIFATIGANCPAWKFGPRSSHCANTVNSFSVSLEYTNVNKEFAKFFASTLFTNKVYAPCNSNVEKCSW